MHRGSKIRDLPYPSRTVPEVSGVCGVGYFGTSREHAGLLQGAGAGNQHRVWMLATEMGDTGGKFETKWNVHLPRTIGTRGPQI